MKISVIIPSYKPQYYIWKCLESLSKQTLSKEDFEIILILNGCNEPYKSDIKNYISTQMNGMNINFIHTEQGGVSNARNIALEYVKGEHVAFIDDDDYVSECYLEDLYKVAQEGYIPLSNIVAFDDITGSLLPYYLSDFYKSKSKSKVYGLMDVRKWFSVPVCKLIPKEVIGDKKFDLELQNGEDCLYMFYISNKMSKFKLTPSSAIYYRRCRVGSANFSLTKRRAFENMLKLFPKYIKIYFSSPLEYNFLFFCSRLVAIILNVIR